MSVKIPIACSLTLALLVACTPGSTPRGTAGQSSNASAKATLAPPALVRADALDAPSKHAWDLFLNVNHPALDPKLGRRGMPDLSKPIGAPGTTTVWETWRAASPEVFKSDGSAPPADYNDMTLVTSCPSGIVPEAPKHTLVARLDQLKVSNSNGISTFFDPEDGVDHDNPGFGETRMNKSTYDTILKNKLYNLESVTAYARDVIDGKRAPLVFDPDSIEVKAGWIKLTEQQIAKGDANRYYTVNWNNEVFGLETLHIITKDLPNWFWVTFHHKDGPAGGFETPDTYGAPDVLKGTVWENYVLGGSQTDFVNSIGEDTLLSDAYIERKFLRSSCISCHARAALGPNGERLSGIDPKTGIPVTAKFKDASGKLIRVQTDFVWSIPARVVALTPGAPPFDPCAPSSAPKPAKP